MDWIRLEIKCHVLTRGAVVSRPTIEPFLIHVEIEVTSTSVEQRRIQVISLRIIVVSNNDSVADVAIKEGGIPCYCEYLALFDRKDIWRDILAYVYPTHSSCKCMGEQKGPLSAEVPFMRHAVSIFFGIPGAEALAVAR